ncbi:uncharacterized protein [Rutidosis leptorrhynchoides]|uniref:uncharacterized protein isoform X2 n=1 Tax=Rutidosis leptorrhynchoides TaxID=125765 RepID=UPI003A9947FA
MAAISVKRNSFLSRFKPLLSSQCFYCKFVEFGNKPQFRSDKDSVSNLGEINTSKWKKMNSRSLGITGMMVPSSLYTLLKILRSNGYEAYLVGGCVRDLLLYRTPKDFDVITTADLRQIKKHFHRCSIVGQRFPICMVRLKGTVFEVSSFKTLAKNSEAKEKFLVSRMPRGCDKSDLNLWKNSMHRDFTVNSLFFDPLSYKIYDYNNGMKDLLDLKLRTLVPAHMSFTEDCARILRGIRIAARLGLSLSKDVETAIHKQASSLLNLSTVRLMMEMDYMLSYGAAESSLGLLHRFNILEILLPFQAAYISRQNRGSGECNMMLMLFSHMDKLVSCGHPSACTLWIGVLAFHQALVYKSQHPFVVLTFGSVLYHQNWNDGLNYARKHGGGLVGFEPETSDQYKFISNEEVAEKVHELAMLVLDFIDIFVDKDRLHKTISEFLGLPCSGLVFIPKKVASGAEQLFRVLTRELETYDEGRSSFDINYELLKKGEVSETRFTLGKIILNTMGCVTDHKDSNNNNPKSTHVMPSDLQLLQPNSHNNKKQKLHFSSNINKQIIDTQKKIEDNLPAPPFVTETLPLMPSDSTPISDFKLQHNVHSPNKQKLNKKSSYLSEGFVHDIESLGNSSCPKIEDCDMEKTKEASVFRSPMQELISTMETITETEILPSQLESQQSTEGLDVDTEVRVDQSTINAQNGNKKKTRKQVLPLSSLFK